MKVFEYERIQKNLYELSKYRISNRQLLGNLQLKIGETWQDYAQGTFFGQKNEYYTLKGKFTVPEDWQEKTVALQVVSFPGEWDNSTNPQMKVYLNDQYLQAIDVNHKEVILSEEWFGKEVQLRVEIFSGREEKQFPLTVELLCIDPLVQKTYLDYLTVFDAWRAIREFGGDQLSYQKVLTEAANALDFRVAYSEEFYHGLEGCQEKLATIYDVTLTPTQKVTAVGHTHIDLAWLWTVLQAIEKGERSYQTVLKLMDEFPDYTFIQSQPQMYQFIKDKYPELYQKIKEKIQAGRWEVDGAMWVEADCNLTSGESLVRQILYGKRFIKEEFDIDSQLLWLPDVFGYSAALPQILKKSNVPYFMTTKLSWNQFNQIPYDSFYWQGIDGSRVLTHFIRTLSEGYSPTPYYSTYNGMLDPYTIKGTFDRYQEKEIHDEILLAYGYGDGGGGPTRNMLEVQQRLSQPLPDMPVITGDHAGKFFNRLEQRFSQVKPPVWFGELYFEYHRGTLTSIGKNKKNNRYGEFLLQTIEKLYATYNRSNYPKEQLEQLWKNLLLNQFHDILPGSAIQEVYDQTDIEYQELFTTGKQLIEALSDTVQENRLSVYNPLGIKRKAAVVLENISDKQVLLAGKPLVMQQTHNHQILVQLPEMDSLSIAELEWGEKVQLSEQQTEQLSETFETVDFLVTFNEHYEIISLIDKKHQRELVPEGERLNQLVAYEDLPMNYDAWDIDIYYDRKSWSVDDVTEAKIVERGPIRDTLLIKRNFQQSTITQYIHFNHLTNQIDFETEVDWHLHHVLLKAQMPLDIHTLEATFDIQFGNVTRALHRNTSWDLARFESCGQKWVDLSEGNYGVSLLNDSKYGFSTDYQKIGISLIKSATDPYPEADQGHHQFTYSLFAHAGDWKQGKTMKQALELNVPALVLPHVLPSMDSFMNVDQENILLDTIKQAEDSDALVVRLYEYQNKTTQATLTINQSVEKVYLCNLLEEDELELEVKNHQVTIPFKPYEIQTLKVFLQEEGM